MKQAEMDPVASPRFRECFLPARRVILWAIVAALFTAAMVNYSARHGRLLARPTYDDVSYFDDALHRLLVLDSRGVAAFLGDFRHSPPHSPWAALLAMGSYSSLGLHDWAPYAGNGLIVFALLLFVDQLMTGASLAQRLGAAALVLAAPMTGECIVEFRPDCAAGLATAMGIITLLRPTGRSGAWRRHLLAGAFFAFALLIKPSVVPLTVVVAGAAWVMDVLIARVAHGQAIVRSFSGRSLGVFLLPSLILALPFYIIARAEILGYIDSALWGPFHHTFQVGGSGLFQAAYYLTGDGGRLMLGRDLWLLLALGTAQWIRLLRRPDRVALIHWLALNLVLLVGYVLPAANQPKNAFVGAAFQFLLLLMAVMVVRDFFAARSLFPWMVIVLAVAFVRWPTMTFGASGSADTPPVIALNRVQREVYESIARNPLFPAGSVFTTTAGPADAYTIRYLALLAGNDLTATYDLQATDLSQYRQGMERADFIVASEPGNGFSSEWAASGRLQQQTLELARSLPDYQQIAVVPALNGKRFFVFARRPSFFGFDSTQGFDPIEGPYPQWGLPQVRWGMGSESRVEIRCDQSRDALLSLMAGTMQANQSIAVFLNEKHLKDFSIPPYAGGWVFRGLSVALRLRSGRNTIELRYSGGGPIPPPDLRQVLFKGIWIDPPDRNSFLDAN